MSPNRPFRPEERAATPAAPTATARDFLAVLFRRKWIIAGLFVVTTLTVAVVTFGKRAEWTSSGDVLVRRGEQESIMTPTRRVTGMWEEELGSELQITKSWPVQQIAAKKLEEQTQAGAPPVVLQPARMVVEVLGKSNVISIGYTAPDSATARRVCAALLDAYLEFRGTDLSLAYPRQFFEEEIARVQKELDQLMVTRRDFAVREDVTIIGEQQRAWIGQLSSLEARRADAAADLAEAQTMQRKMEELKSDPTIDLPTFTQLYSNESALVEIKRRIVDQEMRLAQLREQFTDESPSVVSAQNTIDTLRSMLQREVDARLHLSRSKVEMLGARLAVFDQDRVRLKTLLEATPARETRITELDRRIDLLKNRMKDLVEMSDHARVNERTSARTNVYLMVPARPASPTRQLDYVRLALAPAFSLVVGLGLAFFIDGLDLTVRTAGHAEEAAELPVLAAVGERRRSRGR